MTDKKHARHSGNDVASDIIGGAAAALAYTDQEIIDTLPKEQAHEFIELRNKVFAGLEKGNNRQKYSTGYDTDEEISLAAEDNAVYE